MAIRSQSMGDTIITYKSDISIFHSFQEVFRFRYLLWSFMLSELRTRYKGSVLGFLWTFVNPLLTLLVYSIVFSTVLRIKMADYASFLLVGLLSWNMFASAIQSSAGVVLRQAGLVKKVYFPRQLLPLAVVGSNLLNFVFSCCILLPFLVIRGHAPGVNWLWLFPLTLTEAIMAAGFSFFASAINVYLRDVEHILSIILMLWFYVTPIVYSPYMIPHRLLQLFKLNPVSGCIFGFQSVLYFQTPLHWKLELYSSIVAMWVFLSGWYVFTKMSARFAEEI